MEKPVLVVGLDDSDLSFYALERTLHHFFSASPENFQFKLVVVVNARHSLFSTVGLKAPGAANVCMDRKKIGERLMEKAKEICAAKSVNDVVYEVVEGDARNVLCEAVEKHHASMLVVGSHGYGAIKRAVLGSVSDYCAHHAHCSVMIVKKPKTKD